MTNRFGLYVMAFITMVCAWQSCENTRILKSVNNYSDKIQTILKEETRKRLGLEMHVGDVIATPRPEKFYIIDGDTAYTEIDGKPVRRYFKREMPDSSYLKLPQGGIR